MTGFVYKWTNTINGRWYIGSHKGTPDDGYRHSSKILAAAEEKYGIENFEREILFEGDYEKDQIRLIIEAKILREENAANNPMSYNLSNISGPNCWNEARKKKASKMYKGKSFKERFGSREKSIRKAQSEARMGITLSDETKEKMRQAKLGTKQSSEHKKKRSEAMKRYWADQTKS